MEVDGKAFKKAREQIRKEHADEAPLYGEAAIGTQKWLAEKSVLRYEEINGEKIPIHPTVKTIQNLENKGVASLPVIDAVASVLRIRGREFIIGYGHETITCEAPRVVDFRPILDMQVYPEEYDKQAFLITIDPLIICFNPNDDLDHLFLKEITLSMCIDDISVDYLWTYYAAILPETPWPGIVSMASGIELGQSQQGENTLRVVLSPMFKQVLAIDNEFLWEDFIRKVNKTEKNSISLEVTLHFEYFEKNFKVLISIEELRYYMEKSREKYRELFNRYELTCPRFFQPRALIWDERK